MKKTIIIICILLIGILLISLFILSGRANYRSIDECKSACLKKGFADGSCKWPMEMKEESLKSAGYPYEKVENLGSCVIGGIFAKSKHCGNKGQCNCYCFDYKK